MAMSRRSGASRVMSRSPIRNRPLVGLRKPAIVRSSVVLPQPDEPSNATSSPRPTASDRSCSTGVEP